MNLGENLKKLRKLNHLTQEEVAQKLSVSKQAVYKWETNRSYPDIENLMKLSQVYDIKLDDLLNNEVKEKVLVEKYVFDRVLSEVEASKKAKENYYKYVTYFPLIGLIISLGLFILFFVIKGTEEKDYLVTILYCMLPIIIYMLMYIPMRILLKKSVH